MKKIKLKQLIREVIKEEKLNLSKLSKSEIKQIEKKIRKIERDNTILFAGYTKDGLAPTFLTDKSDAEY